jgi:hypothetical protein
MFGAPECLTVFGGRFFPSSIPTMMNQNYDWIVVTLNSCALNTIEHM